MKSIFYSFFLFLLSLNVFSQEKATDIFSVKAGLIGAWIGYEKSLSENFTLSGEIGYEGGFFGGEAWKDNFSYVLTSTFSIDGKYYYNFDRRIEKDKNTIHNAANYIGLEMQYVPDFGTISGTDNVEVVPSLSVYSKYGLKRNLSNHINFEFALGPGYRWADNGSSGFTVGLDLRFGYNF
ncbi:hypothetical protein [Moheibacter stercoris]|uniref:Outer membrane protein beta-barrel domain-containing protein n=1 Tax=Moheibacter stercoris TaxID=1628251 RepID=A0ABV2LRX8_9FLAO